MTFEYSHIRDVNRTS